ncbi:MAG: prolipoprotein diacylglyceryl transferase [Bacteriovoracales bacterium]|nr:prolipoprotein diacylglyceryl transferase [Bacteriovoracales bacterium]
MWVHQIDPVIVEVFGWQIRWYGLMYIIGFIIGGQILIHLSKEGFLKLKRKEIDAFVTTLILGMILGARLIYVFVYNWDYYRDHLLELLSIWQGGLSFHGALMGFVVVIFIWAKRTKRPFYQLGDSLALAGTLGVGFGRIGNFINGELYGRVSEAGWGVVFPEGGPYPRHPSQLYEAFFEGFFLFSILWFLRGRVRFHGVISAVFLIGYGTFRYGIEFFREADPQLGYYFGGTTTMGQILCVLMIVAGFGIYAHAKKNRDPVEIIIS